MSGVRPVALSGDGVVPGEPPALVIGLVNNMPDAALEATENQFRDLLSGAAGSRPVALRLLHLPQVPRSAAGRAFLDGRYESVERLHEVGVDALIVTGTEPRSARLQDEPYWGALAALVDWAQEYTISTVWSCLAAHAAVHHLDGIERRPFRQKLFGVFACRAEALHPLTAGLGEARRVPHSRHNDVPEERLAGAGYQVLARSDEVGADLFIKEYRSLFVFIQGHPEYDRRALLREYRRDVGRYLGGEREHSPPLPHGHFDDSATQRFDAFREQALRQRALGATSGLLAQFPEIQDAGPTPSVWRPEALRLYANWLALLEQRQGAATVPSRSGRTEAGTPEASGGG